MSGCTHKKIWNTPLDSNSTPHWICLILFKLFIKVRDSKLRDPICMYWCSTQYRQVYLDWGPTGMEFLNAAQWLERWFLLSESQHKEYRPYRLFTCIPFRCKAQILYSQNMGCESICYLYNVVCSLCMWRWACKTNRKRIYNLGCFGLLKQKKNKMKIKQTEREVEK